MTEYTPLERVYDDCLISPIISYSPTQPVKILALIGDNSVSVYINGTQVYFASGDTVTVADVRDTKQKDDYVQ